ncbi:MAG: hypothetical protein KJ072_04670, partial [Verrucomicrobia bacterium]|nr:hypothetical protein [Verrucomicrobiota bacterium]
MKTATTRILLASVLLSVSLAANPGDPDPSFNLGTGFDGPVTAIVSHPGDKLLVAGNFKLVNGEARTNIVRLQIDGQI